MALTKISGSILKDPLNLGEVSIGGTLTYQDVTNVDSVGIVTARAGINVSGGQLDVGSNIKLGNAGIITATELDISGDLDVDGHTNLDNVSIAGVATVTAAQADVATFTSNQTASTIYVKDTDGDGIFISGSSAYGHRIYTNTTEDLLLGTNSAERLRITSDGKIGINVTDPDSNLEVNRGSEGKYMTVGGDDASNGRALTFTSSEGGTGSNGALHTINAKSGNGAIALATAGTERLRINNMGHLGLNVTPGSWDNTFKALEGGGTSKHGELFFQANGDWTTALGCNLYFNSGWKYRHTGAANWLEMKANQTTFYMADSGSADSAISWLQRLRIHSPGYITKPYQVAFFAHCSIGNHDLDVGDIFLFNTIPSSNPGTGNYQNVAYGSNRTTFGGTNVFNTSTQTFTAPVAGLYSFTVTAYYRRTGDPLGPIVPRVNNSEVTNANNNVMFFANSSPTDGDTLSGTVILELAANDAVTIHRRNHGTGTVRFYGPHSHFCGHLIG